MFSFKSDMSFEGLKKAYQQKTYRPWGALKTRNFLARLQHTLLMAVLGMVSLLALALMAVFAASVAVIGFIGFMLMSLASVFSRKPAEVKIKAEDGVIQARKVGDTWITY